MEMLGTLLITLLIVAICIVLLGVKVFFVKGGKFPNGHVSGIKRCGIEESGAYSRKTERHRRKAVSLLMNWRKP